MKQIMIWLKTTVNIKKLMLDNSNNSNSKRVTRIHDMTKLYEVTYKYVPKVIKKWMGVLLFQN